MVKIIYLVELTKQSDTNKFKFAIEDSIKSIKDLKEDIKQKLIHKKQLQNEDEISIQDTQDFELCSDDDIEDVLP
jgi:hypothetical protein